MNRFTPPEDPADELADVRAEIARLHRREARLLATLASAAEDDAPRAALRPGWPIRRHPSAGADLGLH